MKKRAAILIVRCPWPIGAALVHGLPWASKVSAGRAATNATGGSALLYNLPKWDMALRLRNVFDKDYYASAHGSVDLITPGAPRTLELSANYRF